MSDPIETICALVGCSRDIAEESYFNTNNVLESVDALLSIPPKKYTLPVIQKLERTPEQEELEHIRKLMEHVEVEIQEKIKHKTLTGSNPLCASEPDETTCPHEETAQQNSCFQECQLPVLESGAQTQETACP